MSASSDDLRAKLAILAGKIPLASLDPNAAPAPSLDAAAYAFRSQFDPKSRTEQSGVLYGTPNGYQPSIPVTQSKHDQFALRAALAKGNTLGAIFHNHPGDDPRAPFFSPEDIQTANQLKVPSYILFQDGSIRKYVPGSTKTSSMRFPGDRFDTKVAAGDPIDVAALQAQLQLLQSKAQQYAQPPADPTQAPGS